MPDDTSAPRMRPRLVDAPTIPAEVQQLFDFVWRRREEAARRAAHRRDRLMQNFALRSLGHLVELRHWLDGQMIASEMTVDYLRRCAVADRAHPDFVAVWEIDD
ncbi:hypothetical protein ASE01_09995 [Nocardioides sp. Root190]|uniref:hypothetical protein n=1 Tax=Nocardioides sp. Root190 TaxID=1736488 RepID=UPI0006FE4116|nr:hypothetical protein [Nocardioides sp. Root190]KRB77078.1 hypothetical protein ASE01_09995 [Nocardioides sp. Root190]